MDTPIIDMPELPKEAGLVETECLMIHTSGYLVMMDGLDCYIFKKSAQSVTTLTELCKMSGPEATERLGIALLRAANLQRKTLKKIATR